MNPPDASASPAPSATLSRRAFIGGAAAAATVLAMPRALRGATEAAAPAAPARKLRIAGVGIGGQGGVDIRAAAGAGGEIIALCDVDADYAAGTFADFPAARRYTDFREMLEKEPDVEAVMIGTPDHLHAIVTKTALQHGKHVYCEKPLTRTVAEARAIATLARTAGVATQMGNQGMAYPGNRQLDAWVQGGAIGAIREVHVWSDRPTQRGKMPLWWPQGVERPTDTPPVPPTLDWDRWLGPAPARPYHPAYAPFRWRGWWDFGSGGLGDMGIHNLAPVFSALKLGAPLSVSASSTALVSDSVPLASLVHYDFPARDAMPAVTLHWYDGGLLPPPPGELETGNSLDPEDGILLVGDKGKILVEGWGGEHPRILTRGAPHYRRPPSDPEAHTRHIADWIAGALHGTPTRSPFTFAGPVTEAVLLGAACVRHGGRKLVWDHDALAFTNDPRANQYLRYIYRPGWAQV